MIVHSEAWFSRETETLLRGVASGKFPPSTQLGRAHCVHHGACKRRTREGCVVQGWPDTLTKLGVHLLVG